MKYAEIVWRMDKKYGDYWGLKMVKYFFLIATLSFFGMTILGFLDGEGILFGVLSTVIVLIAHSDTETKPASTKPSDLFAWYLRGEIDRRTHAKFANKQQIIQLRTQEIARHSRRASAIEKEKTRIDKLPNSPAKQAMIDTLQTEIEEIRASVIKCEAMIKQAGDDTEALFKLKEVWNNLIVAQMGKVQFIQETVMPRKPFGHDSLKTDTTQLQKEIEDALKSMFDHPDFQDPSEQGEKAKDESLTPT